MVVLSGMRKTFQLMEVLDNLSRMPRSGGVVFSGMSPNFGETVAEHSYKVIWLTLLFYKKVNKSGSKKISLEKLLEAATTHDWPEAILLDIPSGSPSYQSYFEDINLRDVVEKAEKKAFETIEEYVRDEIDLKLNEFNLNETEKAIFKSADITALLMEILSWKFHGMKFEWFDYMWTNSFNRLETIIKENLPEIDGILAELKESFESGQKPTNPFLTLAKFQKYKK